MLRYLFAIVLLAPLLFGGCPSESGGATVATTAVSGGSADAPYEQVIVETTPGASDAAVNAAVEDAGATVAERLTDISAVLLNVRSGQGDTVAAELSDSPYIEGVLPNNTYAADPSSGGGDSDPWHLGAIRAPAAWSATRGNGGVVVAVLDTGVDSTHPALSGRVQAGANTFDGLGGSGDAIGHGTAVAGTIAGAADGAHSGVAPSVSILPIRVTNDAGQATSWTLAAGLTLALDRGARIINISMTPENAAADPFILRQCERARVRNALVVFAMGNSGARSSAAPTEAALFVSASTRSDTLASFATYGPAVALAAPGVDIEAPAVGGGYSAFSGSSLSAPVVSGVAALALSVNTSLRASTLRGVLLASARDVGPAGVDEQFGAGVVDAAAAVALAAETQQTNESAPPTPSITSPAEGAVVSGATTVQAAVSNAADLADLTLSIDGRTIAIDAAAPYAFVFDAPDFAAGSHTLRVVATDIYGNTGADELRFEVKSDEDTTPPALTLVTPAAGARLSGTVTLRVDATDDRELASAEFLVGGTSIATVSLSTNEASGAYTWNVASSSAPTGDATFTVRVRDAAGNSQTSSVRVTIAR